MRGGFTDGGQREHRRRGEKLVAEALAAVVRRGVFVRWRLALGRRFLPLPLATRVQNFVRVARRNEKGDEDDEKI